MGNIRLKDIAERAGTSVSAVSKALSDSGEIGKETQNRIIAIAKELGYHANASARTLRSGKSKKIGVILPHNTGLYADILGSIEKQVASKGYTVIVLTTQDDITKEESALSTLLSMPVDAIIAAPYLMKQYERIRVPTVFIFRYPYYTIEGITKAVPSNSYVVVDDFLGQYIAVKHILECCGENHYLILGSDDPENVPSIKDLIREGGYRKAIEEAGIHYNAGRVIYGAITVDDGYRITMELCKAAHKGFGLCVRNDMVAIGVYHALYDNGLRIPEDVSVIGYDNVDISAHLTPPLTTVHSRKNAVGSIAADYILDALQSEMSEKKEYVKVLEPRLIVRNSTKKLSR